MDENMDENIEINDSELDEVAGGNIFGDIVNGIKSLFSDTSPDIHDLEYARDHPK